MNDTIAAIATPFGTGGIGVIRISGPDALDVVSLLFGKTRKGPEDCKNLESHKVYHGYIFDPESLEVMDEVLMFAMLKPSSYTAEDVVEIQAHSGTIVLRSILNQVVSNGARLAEPGEFTKRAFLNQRIDLTQAEAVADIINARSTAYLKFAASQSLGTFRAQIKSIKDNLFDFLTLLEASIDFPDDTQSFIPSDRELKMVDDAAKQCGQFIKQHDDACFLKDGIKITICGAPNVGKSSLMNSLINQEKSIVTSIPGTTRDPIQEGLNIDGVHFVISDTAGIHQTDDLVEIIGIEKAKEHIAVSDLVLLMKAAGSKVTQVEIDKIIPADKKAVIVINKIDLVKNFELPELPPKYKDMPLIGISVLQNTGIEKLKELILNLSIKELDMEKSSVIPNLRHKKALEQTVEYLNNAKMGIMANQEEETLALDIKNAIESLGTLTGETAPIDVLDNIFSNFCIGK